MDNKAKIMALFLQCAMFASAGQNDTSIDESTILTFEMSSEDIHPVIAVGAYIVEAAIARVAADENAIDDVCNEHGDALAEMWRGPNRVIHADLGTDIVDLYVNDLRECLRSCLEAVIGKDGAIFQAVMGDDFRHVVSFSGARNFLSQPILCEAIERNAHLLEGHMCQVTSSDGQLLCEKKLNKFIEELGPSTESYLLQWNRGPGTTNTAAATVGGA